MDQSTATEQIIAQLQGDVSGQVAVGNYNLQIGSIHGGIVTIIPPDRRAAVRGRPAPVIIRPRPFPGLLDRETELVAIAESFRLTLPVEYFGEAGIGKTALLRHLAHHSETNAWPDGIVYLSARQQPAGDLMQSLFDAFYESDVPLKATDAEIRLGLQRKRALVLLDDVDVPRDDITRIMDAASGCQFVLTTLDRHLWDEARAIPAQGLPIGAAIALLEREMDAPISPDDRLAAESICRALQGHPLRIIQAAAVARERRDSLAALSRRMGTPPSPSVLSAETLEATNEKERAFLTVLAALRGAPIETESLAAVTGVSDADAVLEGLRRSGLIQVDRKGSTLPSWLGELLPREWKTRARLDGVVTHFSTWAEAHRKDLRRLEGSAETLAAVLGLAITAGLWDRAVRLSRSLEGALALSGRWETWARVSGWGLEAARALGDRNTEAWALHQLGTRALCLADRASAETLLTQALRLREAERDRLGAAVTRHNLGILTGTPVGERREERQAEVAQSARPEGAWPGIARAVSGVLSLAILGLIGFGVLRATRGDSVALAFTPEFVDFGLQRVGAEGSPRTVTIRNIGGQEILIGRVILTGPAAPDFRTTMDRCSHTRLSPASTCAIAIAFVPGVEGRRDAILRVEGPTRGPPVEATISGVGTPRGTITARPRHLDFPLTELGRRSAPLEIAVTNSGLGARMIHRVSVEGTHAGDFRKGRDTCSQVALTPNGTCRVGIIFSPQVTGPRQAELRLEIEAETTPQTLALAGNGAEPRAPKLMLSPRVLDFGAQTVGQPSRPRRLTISNSGTAPLRIFRIRLEGQHRDEFAIRRDACSNTTLPPAGQCTLELSFTPQDTGSRSASLRIESNAPDSPHILRLGGVPPIPSPQARLSPGRVEFGRQNLRSNSRPRTITLSNTGNAPLQVGRVTITGPAADDFSKTADSCSNATIQTGERCALDLTFTPRADGTRTAVLQVETNASPSPSRTSLSGVGSTVTPPQFYVEPGSLDFGPQEVGVRSASRTIHIVNTGTVALTVRRVPLGGPHAIDFTLMGDTCSNASLAPSRRCAITLTFTPAIAGIRTAHLTVLATQAPLRVSLAGTGVAGGALTVEPAELDFGDQELSVTSEPRELTLTNTGSGPVAIRRIPLGGTHAIDFKPVADSCSGRTLRPGNRCQLKFTFTPQRIGPRTAFLTILTTHAQQRITLRGAGSGRAILAASPESLDFGAQDVGRASGRQAVTIRNRGTASLLVRSVTVTGPDRADFAVDDRCAGTELPPGGSCSMTVVFTPTRVGTRSAVLGIASMAGGRDISLTGTGVGRPTLVVRPDSIIFETTEVGGKSPPVVVTIMNEGTSPLSIDEITIAGDQDFGFDPRCRQTPITRGNPCAFSVIFAPRTQGPRAAFLEVRGGTRVVSISLRGTGTTQTLAVAEAKISPLELAFVPQPVGSFHVRNVGVSNVGAVDLTLRIAIIGRDSGDFRIVSSECSSVLGPGKFCRIYVQFSPQTTGLRMATLVIGHNAPGSPREVQLRGLGTSGTVVTSGPAAVVSLPAPTGLTPGNSNPRLAPKLVTCAGTFTFRWQTVSHPALAGYEVAVEVFRGGWTPVFEVFTKTTQRGVTGKIESVGGQDTIYRWTVRARDAAGNRGVSAPLHFFVCTTIK